ncbi:hypothetical protein JYU34_018284 [Plutella xylostella]|uniref:Non-structural maintenance of chromosomes element 4 n=1 Tax=Plutella xylostella TaxID=51655 RepID=A0ABQ7Q063_PLUXY|nr:hypothetical protein JYU34_018284 [Plutella xylostella]
MSQASRVSMSSSHDRKLRYRALLEDLSSLDIESSNNDELINKTSHAVHEAHSLLAEGGVEERVKHPGEGFLDSQVLRASSDLAVRGSESVSGNVHSYDRHELAQHIKENPQFWSFPLPRAAPPLAYLFGSFAPAPPEQRPRAPRRRTERQQLAALKEPENVEQLEKTEEGSEMVSRVNRFITKQHRSAGRPLSYFHLVLDPGSFARTIENVYYVSFLVRDGFVAIDVDESCGLPFVTPVPAARRESTAREHADENQFIVSLDMKTWQEFIDALGITEPMMTIKRL